MRREFRYRVYLVGIGKGISVRVLWKEDIEIDGGEEGEAMVTSSDGEKEWREDKRSACMEE